MRSRHSYRSIRFPLTAAAVVLACGGCASSPDSSPAAVVEMPADWSTSPPVTSAAAPHLLFEQPALKALIQEALTHNAELERIAAILAQRLAEARISGADLAPSADLGLNTARQRISTFGPNSTGGVIFENYDLSLNLSWEIDLWGRLRDRQSAAIARVEMSQAELDAARLSLAAQVTKRWLDWIEAGQQVVEAERTAQAYRANQQSLERRFEHGLAETSDLRRLRSLVAAAEAELAGRRRAFDTTARNLQVLLGRYPDAAIEGETRLPELEAPIPQGIPADLIQRRPDLIAAERNLAATDRELTASRKDLLPRIALTSGGGTTSQDFSNLLDGDFRAWSLAGNLAQPIFQGGRIRAGIDRSASLRDQARAAYRNAALQAYLEVERTLAAESFLQRNYDQLRIAAREADAAEALLRERYHRGTADFLELLDAERSAAGNRSQLLSAQNRLLQNRVDLLLALGGPF